MDCKYHPNSEKNSRTIASNTNTIICGACGTKQHFQTCLHTDIPDSMCHPNPEWHPCADHLAKNCRIEPLLSSPSLLNPLCANTAMLQTPNVFHSHSSMGVRLLPSSNPCLSKETQELTKESIYNSKSSMNQSIKKGKSRPGGRPKSRAGCDNLEESNIPHHFVPVPREPNCCPIPYQPSYWQNYCRFPSYPYPSFAVPVPHYIPIYIPVPASDVESNCDHDHGPASSCQQEIILNDIDKNEENQNESDDDYEKVAKKLVQEFDSDDNEEETNLEELVNKFKTKMNDDEEKVKTEKSNLGRDEISSTSIPLRNHNETKHSYGENEKNERRSSDTCQEKNAIKMETKGLPSKDSSERNEENDHAFQELEEKNYRDENTREAENTKEIKIISDFEEKSLTNPSTPMNMSLKDYDFDAVKNSGNGESRSDLFTESDDGNNSKTRSNGSRLNFKQDIEQDEVDRIMNSLEALKSSKEDSQEYLNIRKQDEHSEDENDSDDDNSDEKFENSAEIVSDSKNSYHEDKEENFKIINVYKKEISNEDGKDDWLDTEEEILTYARKDSYDKIPLKIHKESELTSEKSFSKRSSVTQYVNKSMQEEEDEGYTNIKRTRQEKKEDNNKKFKDSTYSPWSSAKVKNQDQGSNVQGEKFKNVTNKLIYTAIINKKDEKEKGECSPYNSPRWKDDAKKNGNRQKNAEKRWKI